MPRIARKAAEVTDPSRTDLFKEVEIFSIPGMVTDSLVATREFHVSKLAFPRVVEDLIRVPAVVIPVWLTASREEQDIRTVLRRRNPALLLASMLRMNIAALVDLPNLKHVSLPKVAYTATSVHHSPQN